MLQIIPTFGYRLLRRHRLLKRKKKISDANLAANKAFEPHFVERLYRGRYVTDQRKLRDYKLGDSDMAAAGCEIIAVYNACELCRNLTEKDEMFRDGSGRKDDMLLLDKIRGDRIHFYEMIHRAENGGYLVRFGKWGTNPMWLPSFAAHYGLTLQKTDNKLPQDQGVYILSFWNNRKVLSGVHTVCIQIMGDTAVTYNLHYSDSPVSFSLQKLNALFREKMLIAVYSVTPKAS